MDIARSNDGAPSGDQLRQRTPQIAAYGLF
jgi:hypothetical protein